MDDQEKKIYPDVPAEIPGVPLQEGVNSGAQATDFQDTSLSLRARMAKAGANANPPDQSRQKDRGVTQSDESVTDLTGDSPVEEPLSRGVYIKTESSVATSGAMQTHDVDTVNTPVPGTEGAVPEPTLR